MKSNVQAKGPSNKAIESASYAEARTHVGLLRKNFMALRPFWAEEILFAIALRGELISI